MPSVPVEGIVEAVWPGKPPAASRRHAGQPLRATLGPDAAQGGPLGYRLGRPPAIHVDEAARLLEECRARADPRLAASAGRRACNLLGDGPALAGEPDADWVVVAARRPFVYVPLEHHFEQQIHVPQRLAQYRAGRRPTPTRIPTSSRR